MTKDTPTVKEIVREFDEVSKDILGLDDALNQIYVNLHVKPFLKKWIVSKLTSYGNARYEEGVQEGRNQILEEWNHNQRKLLDGLNHPKDCKLCGHYDNPQHL